MVGCSLTSTSDHTFAALKIWGDVAGAETIHTINVESVEIASAVIVPSTKAHDFSHAAEQFSRRYNVRPKCNITDVWPHGDTLWKALYVFDVHFESIIPTMEPEQHRSKSGVTRKLRKSCQRSSSSTIQERSSVNKRRRRKLAQCFMRFIYFIYKV